MDIRNVVLAGASGVLGGPILDALLATGTFSVSVLNRASSSWTPPASAGSAVRVIDIPDDYPAHVLKAAFEGQDAVIVCLRISDVDLHFRLADAAATAGVRRFIPADFGSVDARSARAQELVPLFKRKVQVQERLEALAAEHPAFTWTGLVNGHFFDWGLRENFLHFDLTARTADILDDGNALSSLSTLRRVSEAVVRVLQREEESRNRLLFVQSFCVSQNQVLNSLEKQTGRAWTVRKLGSEEFIKEHKAKADAGDTEAVEDLVFALGVVDGNWEKKPEFAMSLLGLEDEKLDDVVGEVLSSS